jgi:hypothetical protein
VSSASCAGALAIDEVHDRPACSPTIALCGSAVKSRTAAECQ